MVSRYTVFSRWKVIYIVILICFFGCSKEQSKIEKVRVTGSSTLYPLIRMAAEHLKHDHGLYIEAQAGGSTRGFEDTIAGRNELGAMSRDLTAKERKQVKAFPIAYDGVGIVVHESNPINAVSVEMLRQIYRKKLSNWKELKGADRPIVVVNKAEGHATLNRFLEYTGLDRAELKVDVVAGNNAQVLRVVSTMRDAIGYVSIGGALHASEIGMPIRLIELDGVKPHLKAVAEGNYPIYRTLYLISKGQPQGGSQTLIDFFQSAEGKAIIRKAKYVPLF